MRLSMFAAALVALFVIPVMAQEAEEPNVEKEHLAVLQPYIGTWHTKYQGTNSGDYYEAIVETDWSSSEKMIVSKSKYRSAPTEKELAGIEEWKESRNQFYVWNHNTEQIEIYTFYLGRGTMSSSQVIPNGDGVFTYRRIARSREGRTGDSKMTFTNNDKTATLEVTNRKDSEGEEIPELTIVYIKQD